jgi:glucose/mannose transport system permease protein
MGGQGPGFIKDMPALNMWDTTYGQSRFAQGAAIGVVLLILVSILIIPYLIISLRRQEER